MRYRTCRPDGCSLLKTDRSDLASEEVRHTYSLLTRAGNAFRNIKSRLDPHASS